MRRISTTVMIAIVVVAGIAALSKYDLSREVRAQDQQPPPSPDRISFGMVGITSGQTLRITVANTILPNDPTLPPGPIRVVLAFRGMSGQLMRTRSGDIIRRTVDINRGDAAFLDLDFDALPPGPVRIQVRPVVTVQQPPPVPDTNAIPYDSAVPTVEVINTANGRTQFAVFTNPAVIRGFNPQPDPPIGD